MAPVERKAGVYGDMEVGSFQHALLVIVIMRLYGWSMVA